MIQKKTLVNITALLIVICAFWNIGFSVYSETKSQKQNISVKTPDTNTQQKTSETQNITVSKQIENVTISDRVFDKKSVSEKTQNTASDDIINTSKNCSANYSGGTNKFGVYGGTNTIQCNCKITKSDGIVYETTKKIVQIFHHEPNQNETACTKTCDAICDKFINDLK